MRKVALERVTLILVEHETGLEILCIAGSIASLIGLVPLVLQGWHPWSGAILTMMAKRKAGEYQALGARLESDAIREDFAPPDAFAAGVDGGHRNGRGGAAGGGGAIGTTAARPRADGLERAGFRRDGRRPEG